MGKRKRSARPILPASSPQVGFVTMGASASGQKIKEIGVGMLGCAFMRSAKSGRREAVQSRTGEPIAARKRVTGGSRPR